MSNYAIISVGGKQYRVHEGEKLLVNRLPHGEGKTFEPTVLLTGGGDSGPNLSGSSADARSFFDGSGWTVSTGSARATGATLTRSGDPFGPSTLQTAGVSGPWAQLAMLAVVAVIALRLLRKSSS